MAMCRFLGINGFEFIHEGKTLLLDPYVSRVPKGRDEVSIPEVVRRHVPRADYIVLGHSHYDHLADVPEIVERTGAMVCGSATTLNVCRYFGIDESRLVEFESRKPIPLGPFTVTPVPSLHKQPTRGGGYANVPESMGARGDYLEGGTWALSLRFGNRTVFNLGSANCIEDEIDGVQCDYLLVAIAGRQPEFIPTVLSHIRAGYVIPTHWDLFQQNPVEDPGEKYSTAEFTEEVHRAKPDQKVKVMQVLETIRM